MKDERAMKVRVLAVVVFFAAIAVGGNVWKESLRVKNVSVEGTVHVERNQLIQLADIAPNTPMYDVDLTRVQQNVLSHYFIRSAVAERSLPGTIRITVRERVPLAIIPGTTTMYVDEDGVFLPPENARSVIDLPVISGLSAGAQPKPGTTVERSDVKEAIAILWTLRNGNRDMYHRISEVRVRNEGDIILYSAERGVPIIFGRGGIGDKLARLESFWDAEVTLRGTQQLEYIDLRYEGQVIVRWGTPARQL